MLVPTQWLREYVECPLSDEALAAALIEIGLGVESVQPAPAGLGGAVLELEITPNRGDCLSMVGVAREVAALCGTTARRPAPRLEERQPGLAGRCTVRIDDAELCPRYSARLVTGAQHGPSPKWLQERLQACGQRPIDIFVDATNYVLFELGQPLHAFDHDRLGETIVVRRARDGETFVTLDGVKRTLTERNLLITDGQQGVALGGVMGGANTAVTPATRNILLEAAHFNPPCIRRTARDLGLESESSYRFARTVDPGLTLLALDRCAELLVEYAGAVVAAGVVDQIAKPIAPAVIRLRPSRCNQILGTRLAAEPIAEYLRALELEVAIADGLLEVTVPTFRPDLVREVDLIEEVARRHGFNRIATTVPPASRHVGRPTPRQRLERRLREVLCGAGLTEVQTFSLTSPAAMARANTPEGAGEVGAPVLQNALNEEYSVLRWSLVPSLLEVVGRNEAQHGEPVRVFELGRCYRDLDPAVTDEAARQAGRVATGHTAASLPEPCREVRTLGVAVTGQSYTAAWNLGDEQLAADFYEVKGIVELIAEELRLAGLSAEPVEDPRLAPGRAAAWRLGGQRVGVLGEARPEILERYDIRRPVVLAELDLDALTAAADPRRGYVSLPRFPAALRDVALVVPDQVTHAEVRGTIVAAGGALLERVELFDVYRGKGVADRARSLAYRLTFRDTARTLTDDEVDVVVAAIVAAVGEACGARLRE